MARMSIIIIIIIIIIITIIIKNIFNVGIHRDVNQRHS